jgi:hypothetical protein
VNDGVDPPPQPVRAAWPWAILAGVAFGGTRFLITLSFVIIAVGITQRPIFDGPEWLVAVATGLFAGIGGGVLWWKYQRPNAGQGVLAGLLAAACGYLAVFLVAVVLSFTLEQSFSDALKMTMFCGTGLAVITSQMVVPLLVPLGCLLSIIQRAYTPDEELPRKGSGLN